MEELPVIRPERLIVTGLVDKTLGDKAGVISSNAIPSQSQCGLRYREVNSRDDRRGVFQTRVSTAMETPVSTPPVCAFFALYSCRNATTGFSREARKVGGSAANKHTNIKPSSGKTTVAA
jgi:hypothetical protein